MGMYLHCLSVFPLSDGSVLPLPCWAGAPGKQMPSVLRLGRVQVEAQRKRAEQELKRAQTHKAAMLKALADLQSGPKLEGSARPPSPCSLSQCS